MRDKPRVLLGQIEFAEHTAGYWRKRTLNRLRQQRCSQESVSPPSVDRGSSPFPHCLSAAGLAFSRSVLNFYVCKNSFLFVLFVECQLAPKIEPRKTSRPIFLLSLSLSLACSPIAPLLSLAFWGSSCIRVPVSALLPFYGAYLQIYGLALCCCARRDSSVRRCVCDAKTRLASNFERLGKPPCAQRSVCWPKRLPFAQIPDSF